MVNHFNKLLTKEALEPILEVHHIQYLPRLLSHLTSLDEPSY